MKDLSKLGHSEFNQFFDSFDHVFFDIDGVIYRKYNEKIRGAEDAIKSLRRLGKTIHFVTNNCMKFYQKLFEELRSGGYAEHEDELVTPALAIIDYLQDIKFDKEIYAIAMEPLKSLLRKAGFKLSKELPDNVGENVLEALAIIKQDASSIGAVLIESDINTTFAKLQRAIQILKNPDVVYLIGAPDKIMPFGSDKIIGPGLFQEIVSNITGREPILLAKPSGELDQYMRKICKFTDPSRVLFIGDSVATDMGLATNCGYQKLLVFSGLSKKEDILFNWSFPKEYQPDYYADSLQILYDQMSANNKV